MEQPKSLLRSVFTEAAEIADPAARAAFLDSACKGDQELRARVERLLEADSQAGNFLGDSDKGARFGVRAERIGERIGRYRLLESIGRGGCGVVYLAEQEEPVRRRVALKVIKLGMDTQSVVARFEAERQALAMMDHPNIAKVLDAGATDEGRPFFVMELVSGIKITEYCERQQLSTRQRLELLIPVCHAVQHAHQKGIIHRDLKPSNILVMEHEGVAVAKVIDFGIAKATGPLDDDSGITSVDQIIGTPAYMSPEQVEFGGRDIDTRSDIYSLGVVLYELLAGQPPFDPKELAGAGLDEMRRIIREVDPPRPSTTITKNLNPARLPFPRRPSRERLASVRGDLDWIAMKCLEKDRARRYSTANGLATDIRRHLENEPVAARPPSKLYRIQKILRRNRLAFGAIGMVALALISGVIVSTQQALRARRAERDQERLRDLAETKEGESRQRLIRRYVEEGNRLAELGQPLMALPWMVEALSLEAGDPQREPDERLRIAQSLLGAPELRLNFLQGKSVNCVALSPDGSRLATGSDDGVVRISDVAGGEASTNLVMAGNVGRVGFSPDGMRVVAVDMSGGARMWNALSGEAITPVLHADDSRGNAIAVRDKLLKPAASFSPDGKFLLLAWGSKSAQLRDAASGTLLREFAHDQLVNHAAFSPDGRQVVTSSTDHSARVWDVATGNPVGPSLQQDGAVIWSQFSSDGNRLLTARDRHVVQLWDWRDGRRLAPEIPRRSVLSHASLSPDGSTVLTTARSGFCHLYDAASSRLMYEFQQPGGVEDAAFSPDGRRIAIASHDGNVWVRVPGDATSHPMVLPAGNQIEEIAFSKDGRLLAVGTRAGRARVWDLSPTERGVRRLAGHDVQWVEFDASGRRALALSTGRQSGLTVFDAHTGKLLSAAPFKSNQINCARFSPDGHRVLAFGNGPTALVLDADSGSEVFPALAHQRKVQDALWTPNGKFILTTAGAAGARAWDAATGKIAVNFPRSRSAIAIAVSPDGTRVATDQQDHQVQIYEMPTGKPLGTPFTARQKIRDIQFSPDGRRLAISTDALGNEGIVELRDVASGKVLGRPLVHRDNVTSIEFSRDGRWIATACNDHTARIWDAATGEPVSGWLPHDFETRQAVFSPDGNRLATLARRGAVRLWSVSSGEPLSAPILYSRNTGDGRVSYSPDGQRLLICRGGNEAWMRELIPDNSSIEELRLRAQVLSCMRFDTVAGMIPLDESSLDRAWKQLRALHGKN
jgi:WD40 repeat protein/serine/threonine protein kinase